MTLKQANQPIHKTSAKPDQAISVTFGTSSSTRRTFPRSARQLIGESPTIRDQPTEPMPRVRIL